jgi:hypothetical protein
MAGELVPKARFNLELISRRPYAYDPAATSLRSVCLSKGYILTIINRRLSTEVRRFPPKHHASLAFAVHRRHAHDGNMRPVRSSYGQISHVTGTS